MASSTSQLGVTWSALAGHLPDRLLGDLATTSHRAAQCNSLVSSPPAYKSFLLHSCSICEKGCYPIHESLKKANQVFKNYSVEFCLTPPKP